MGLAYDPNQVNFYDVSDEKTDNKTDYKTDYKTGEVLPNYESIQKGQIFYNPEDGLFYERINNEGLKTDFKELDPFTYD